MTQESLYWDWAGFDNFTQDGLLLRFARASDFPCVRGFVCHPSTVHILHDTSESAEATLQNLWAEGFDAPDMRHFIIESEALPSPIAYLRLLYPFPEPYCLWLSFIVIDPSLREMGYGKRILHVLLAVVERMECVRIFGMHTLSDNVRAIRVFESAGFQCTGCEPWHYEDGTRDERLTFCRVLEKD